MYISLFSIRIPGESRCAVLLVEGKLFLCNFLAEIIPFHDVSILVIDIGSTEIK